MSCLRRCRRKQFGSTNCWRARAGGRRPVIVTEHAEGAFTRQLVSEDVAFVGDREVADAVVLAAGDGNARRVGNATAHFFLVEPFVPSSFAIAVFGAGHVGSALIGTLANLDVDLRWIDSRADAFPPALPANAQAIRSTVPEREVQALPPRTYYLVMTHSHAMDYEICRAVLERGDAAYLGLIGSRAKRRRFLKRLAAEGIDTAGRLTCPIGIDGIDGKTPAEIAISTAAELLAERAIAKSQRRSMRLVQTAVGSGD